jgi:hypothetical protein
MGGVSCGVFPALLRIVSNVSPKDLTGNTGQNAHFLGLVRKTPSNPLESEVKWTPMI